ncbi:MAG TPA: paraquat-inducible protein A [Rhodocyclaceae bacterium]|nr:paraquat-inducible protein A [Rhodocyclaceae bacterium]
MQENMQSGAPVNHLIACPDCDLLQHETMLAPGEQSRCARCDTVLGRRPYGGIDRPLACTLAAVVSFAIANTYPVMALQLQGHRIEATLIFAVEKMYQQGMPAVALLVLFTSVLAPALRLGTLAYLLISLRFGYAVPSFGRLFRLVQEIAPWVMIEVLMLGALVSLVKLGHVATATPGLGLWALAATMWLLATISDSMDECDLWQRYEAAFGDTRVRMEPAR